MADDPFAKYAVAADAADPFAAYAVSEPKKPTTISAVSKDEPGTFLGGALSSLGQTAKDTGLGIASGVLSLFDPRTYAEAEAPEDLMQQPLMQEYLRTGQTGTTLGQAAKDVATTGASQLWQAASDPTTGGAMIGQLGTMLAAPRLAPQIAKLPGRDIVSAPFRLTGYVTGKPPFTYAGGAFARDAANWVAGKIGRTVQPVTGAERTLAGTIGRTPPPPQGGTVNAPTTGFDPVAAMMDEARAARAAASAGAPPPAAPGAAPGPTPGPPPSSAAAAPPAPAGAAPAASVLSAVERAQLTRQGFDAPTIARIEQNLATASTAPIPPAAAPTPPPVEPPPPPTPAGPVTGSLRMAEPAPVAAPVPEPAPPVAAPEPTPRMSWSERDYPLGPTAPPVEAPPPAAPAAETSSVMDDLLASLKERQGGAPTPPVETPPAGTGAVETGEFRSQPAAVDELRQAVGAEKAGRVLGMTKEEVREAATAIGAGTNRGDASLVLPEPRLQKIIEALKKIERGSQARFDYVDKTVNPKNWSQIETIRRVMEALGFIVPVATGVGAAEVLRGTVRDRVQQDQF